MYNGFITLTETKNGEKWVAPIYGTLRETFNRLLRRFVEKDGKDGEKVKELVPTLFHDPDTLKPYGSVKRSFATALKTAKITGFRFHDLRHPFVSQLVMASVDLTTVKELLGHKDIKMTLRYAHLAPAHKRNAINVLDALLTPTPNTSFETNFTITSQSTKKESADVS